MSRLAAVGAARELVRSRYPFLAAYALFMALILLLPWPRVFRDLYYVLVVPPFLFVVRPAELRAIARSWTFRLAVAYLAWMWLTLLWSPDHRATEFVSVGRRCISILIFLVLTAWLCNRDGEFPRRLFGWLGAAAAVTAAVSIYLHYWVPSYHRYRPSAWLWENPNTAGEVLCIVVIGLVGYALVEARTERLRILHGALAAFVTGFVVLTESRAAMLALAASIAATATASRARPRRAAMLGAAAGAVVLGAVVWLGMTGSIGRGDSHRFEVWSRYWSMALEQPWLGHGIGFDPTIFLTNGLPIGDPHDMVLNGLLFGGIPGAALVVALFAAAAWAALRTWRLTGELAPLALAVFMIVHRLFESLLPLYNADWTWVAFWFPIGLIAGAETRAGRPGAAKPA